LKHAVPDFPDKLLFVSFQQNKPIGLFSNTVHEYALYSGFQFKTQEIEGQSQNFKFIGQKIVCPSNKQAQQG